MKKILIAIMILCLAANCLALELVRQKNVATVITFPLIDSTTTTALQSGATAPDSEFEEWTDGTAPAGGFTDCANEISEIGTTGIYSLSLANTEVDSDYTVIQIKASDALTQIILIRTVVGDPQNLATTTAGGLAALASGVNMTSISGDSAAADNLEATYDGTGYNDDVAPATQLQLTGIGGGVSIATIATGSTVTEGDETLTYEATATHDDSYYEVASDTTPVASEDIDFYLTFNTGDGMNFPIFFHLHGYYEDNNAPANSTLNIQSWNFDTSAWNTIATLSDSASDIDLDLPLHVHDVDPDGGGEGDVRIRFKLVATEVLQNMRIDHASVNYVSGAVSAAEVADAVWDEVIVSAHDTSNTAGALLDSPGDWITATGFAVASDVTTAHTTTDAKIDATDVELAKVPKSDGTVSWNSTALAAIELQANDALVDEKLDHLVAVADADDVVDDSIIGQLASTDGDWSNFSEATDSLQSIRDAIALFDTVAEWLSLLSAVDTDATSATHAPAYVTLEAGKASNDAYNGMSISVTDATDGNTETRRIEDWTSGLKATFDRALSFTPVQDDIVRIYAMPYNVTAAIAGGSANTFIVTDTGDAGGTPIADVSVWVTADSAGARLVVSGVTDSSGEVVFYLDAGTTYYVWMAKSGFSFSDNGESWLAE